jgi:hypothetical protein
MTAADWFLWLRLLAALGGLLACAYTLHDALLDFRILRRLNMNSIREVVTTANVIDEVGRFALHAGIVFITALVLSGVAAPHPAVEVSLTFIVMTVILVLMSVNSIVARRKVDRLMRLGEQAR